MNKGKYRPPAPLFGDALRVTFHHIDSKSVLWWHAQFNKQKTSDWAMLVLTNVCQFE